jgi:protein SCO1/2
MDNKSRLGKKFLGASSDETFGLPGSVESAVGLNDVDSPSSAVSPGGGRLPLGDKLSSGANGSALKDGTGDDPFHDVGVDSLGVDDHNSSGVLDALGIGAVDGVGASQTLASVATGGEISGESAGVKHQQEGQSGDDPNNPVAFAHDELVIPRSVKVAGFVLGVFIIAALAFAIFEPIQVLPLSDLAPGYSLTSQNGNSVNSEDGRGTVTLYNFAPTDCGDECAATNETMRTVRDRVIAEVDLDGTEFRLITIALDPVADPEVLAAAAAKSGADGLSWQWLGGTESEIRTIVGNGFRRFYETRADGTLAFDPGFVLVDGSGVVRGEYRYQTLTGDGDKITKHVAILGKEIRYAEGAAAIAYEAAHLFLCYP